MTDATVHISYTDAPWWLRVLLWLRSPIHLRIPSGWSELSTKQIIGVNRFFASGAGHEAMRLLAFKAVTGIPSWLFSRISPEQYASYLLPYTDWILDVDMSDIQLPDLVIGKDTWRIPSSDLKGLTVQWHLDVEREWSALSHSDDISAWMQVFLMPIGHHQPIGKINPWQAVLCSRYYQHIHAQIKIRYPHLYSSDNEDKKVGVLDWDSIPAHIAESSPFGSVEQVLRAPLLTFLAWANDKKQEQQKQEQDRLQEMIRNNHNHFVA